MIPNHIAIIADTLTSRLPTLTRAEAINIAWGIMQNLREENYELEDKTE